MVASRKRGSGPDKGMALGQKYFAAGLRFAGGIVLFVLLGHGLDRWLGITPLGVVAGTIAGTVLSFLSVYRELVSDRDVDADGPAGKF
jgi:F0F1-type ATP synthase assembly protein I